MPVIEYLERNADLYGDEVALVELNPEEKDSRRVTWKEFDLIQADSFQPYRREITWSVFDEKANRFANMLLGRGIKKGDKVMLILKRHYHFWFSMLALHKIGAIAIPATNQLKEHDITYRFNKAGVKMIICTADGIVADEVEFLSSRYILRETLASETRAYPPTTNLLSPGFI